MPREILFKAKRVDNGEWVEGAFLFDGENHCIIGQEIKFSPYIENECKIVGYEVDRETICQYTGLTDKNGNKIWENDVVCTPYVDPVFGDMVNNVILDDYLWKVGFEYGCFCVFNESFCIKLVDFTKERNIKVVSNIFDNPELLENEQMERMGEAE